VQRGSAIAKKRGNCVGSDFTRENIQTVAPALIAMPGRLAQIMALRVAMTAATIWVMYSRLVIEA
jgi:hypothetical protein